MAACGAGGTAQLRWPVARPRGVNRRDGRAPRQQASVRADPATEGHHHTPTPARHSAILMTLHQFNGFETIFYFPCKEDLIFIGLLAGSLVTCISGESSCYSERGPRDSVRSAIVHSRLDPCSTPALDHARLPAARAYRVRLPADLLDRGRSGRTAWPRPLTAGLGRAQVRSDRDGCSVRTGSAHS